ncbi:MAG: hypothetical protein OEW21_07640 [Betaproteobacteria bacterium]|nr:hypothetical protein [Betaproteobacteria bacterium]
MKIASHPRLLCLCLILSSGAVSAQGYEGSPCQTGDPRIRALVKNEDLAKVFISACSPNPGAIATSLLAASGKPPLRVKDPRFTPPPGWQEADGDERYDKWSCMYAGSKISDGDAGTAWVEGVPGDGAGESILVPGLDLTGKVEIFAGYGKSDLLFRANSRPRTVNLHIVRAQLSGHAQCGAAYENVTRVASAKAVLRDFRGFQPLALPAFRTETYVRDGETRRYTYWLMIEIVDVYPGGKYQDTAISEIRNAQ